MTARAILGLLAAVSFGCQEHPSPEQAAAPASAATHEHEAAGPVLDQGRRWKADASTTAAVGRMRQIVDAAPAAASQDLPAL